tara:strand:- start:353 stop:544 length:192 start_codon:yes stop_codon:yes gene_type:complete
MGSSKLPVPTESSSPYDKLQYDYATLYAAYQERGKELEELAQMIGKFQGAFSDIDKATKGVLL